MKYTIEEITQYINTKYTQEFTIDFVKEYIDDCKFIEMENEDDLDTFSYNFMCCVDEDF